MFNMNKKSKNKPQDDVVNPELDAQDSVTSSNENQIEDTETALPIAEEEAEAEAEAEAGDPVQLEKEKYLRLYSEFENFRRRTNKERLDWMQTASKDLMVELLPVVDDMERAMKSMQQAGDVKSVEGMELVFKKLYTTLEKKGLKPMQAQGESFDPEIHEAVTQFEAPTEDMKGKVIDELEKGYFLNDKVIRFAKVVVGK
jgi:molecular chaperone GrpE